MHGCFPTPLNGSSFKSPSTLRRAQQAWAFVIGITYAFCLHIQIKSFLPAHRKVWFLTIKQAMVIITILILKMCLTVLYYANINVGCGFKQVGMQPVLQGKTSTCTAGLLAFPKPSGAIFRVCRRLHGIENEGDMKPHKQSLFHSCSVEYNSWVKANICWPLKHIDDRYIGVILKWVINLYYKTPFYCFILKSKLSYYHKYWVLSS